jgi:Zn-dependent M32 family carboxypeptidase
MINDYEDYMAYEAAEDAIYNAEENALFRAVDVEAAMKAIAAKEAKAAYKTAIEACKKAKEACKEARKAWKYARKEAELAEIAAYNQ